MLDIVVIWLCKVVYWILRRFGRHGAALPGLIAEMLRPSLINKIKNLPEGIVFITGTNGKTTTTHFVAHIYKQAGRRVFTNHSGSNMTRGLLATIVRNSSLAGKLDYDIAILELDEAYAAKLAPILKPKACILTNVLRDQLDRFGEIDSVATLLNTVAINTSEYVVYNVCDSRLSQISKMDLNATKIPFGYTDELSGHFTDDDHMFQVKQASKNNSQLENVPANAILLDSFESPLVSIKNGQDRLEIQTPNISGWHNALNITAAYALTLYSIDVNLVYFRNLNPPYGRGEIIKNGRNKILLQLVKNPAGFKTAMSVESSLPAVIIINDKIADGRDVSWLWDLDFELLETRKEIYCSGTRAYDIALRLKYNDMKAIKITTDYKSLLDSIISSDRSYVVFLTYTAMLETRRYLRRKINPNRNSA